MTEGFTLRDRESLTPQSLSAVLRRCSKIRPATVEGRTRGDGSAVLWVTWDNGPNLGYGRFVTSTVGFADYRVLAPFIARRASRKNGLFHGAQLRWNGEKRVAIRGRLFESYD